MDQWHTSQSSLTFFRPNSWGRFVVLDENILQQYVSTGFTSLHQNHISKDKKHRQCCGYTENQIIFAHVHSTQKNQALVNCQRRNLCVSVSAMVLCLGHRSSEGWRVWLWPPSQDASDHQKYDIFSRVSQLPTKTFIYHCYWEGPHPMYILLVKL